MSSSSLNRFRDMEVVPKLKKYVIWPSLLWCAVVQQRSNIDS